MFKSCMSTFSILLLLTLASVVVPLSPLANNYDLRLFYGSPLPNVWRVVIILTVVAKCENENFKLES
jgi:hypothetical protein